MKNYNQHLIIEKLNQYLKLNNRSLSLKLGYCHGITLLWLYKMSSRQEDWFYKTIDEIINCNSKEDFDAIQIDVEKFIAHIEWLQNSDKYVTGINQLDIEKLIELPNEFAFSCLFSQMNLDILLEKIIVNNKLICISGPNHTIGIFKKDDSIYIFDPNYYQIRPRIMPDIKALKREMILCLFKQNNVFNARMPLEINITRNPAQLNHSAANARVMVDKNKTYEEFVRSLKNIDTVGFGGISNLHLACESGDVDAATILLKNGARPNQVCKSDWTPLLVASGRGYSTIVELLLKFGADPNLANQSGMTPLYLAAQSGQENIVKILLAHGASPTHADKQGKSAIDIAYQNQHPAIVNLMLKRVKPGIKIDPESFLKFSRSELELTQSIKKNCSYAPTQAQPRATTNRDIKIKLK